jgi:Mrp family chromosome partitioning ATPase
VLNDVVEKLGLKYEYYKKHTLKQDEKLVKNTLPFTFRFKDDKVNQTCVLRYAKNLVFIEIDDKLYSFPKSQSKFDNSLFVYHKNSSSFAGEESYIIKKYTVSEAVERLKSNYAVIQLNESNTYEISYSGPNKELNSHILKGIVTGIQQNNIVEKQTIYQMAINYIDVRILELSQKIDSSNYVISNYKVANNVYMPVSQTNAVLTNLDEVERKIFVNSLQSELSTKLLYDLEQQKSFDLLPNDLGIENVNINQMVFEFNKIILEKNNLIDATEKNPLVVQLQRELIDLRSNILNSISIYQSKLETKLTRYNEYKNTNSSLAGTIPLREAELGNLVRDIELMHNLYSYLSQKRVEASISLSSLETNIKLINEVDYKFDLTSNKSKTWAIFSMLGLIFPVGFSLSVFFIRTSYVDLEYLRERLDGIQFLGLLKYSKDKSTLEHSSMEQELLNRVYHNMKILNPESERGNVIMITSCIKNEGKTFTAYSLAKFLSGINKKVVLLGLDQWNPDLHKHLSSKNKHGGLTKVLGDDKNSLHDSYEKHKVSEDNFDVLLSRTNAGKVNDLNDLQRFNDLITYFKGRYDYIIFDTAPVLLKVDSLKLIGKSDFVLNVFRKNHSPKKSVEDVLDYQKKYNPKAMGYVLIDDSKRDKLLDKYAYSYGYGYGYGYGA